MIHVTVRGRRRGALFAGVVAFLSAFLTVCPGMQQALAQAAASKALGGTLMFRAVLETPGVPETSGAPGGAGASDSTGAVTPPAGMSGVSRASSPPRTPSAGSTSSPGARSFALSTSLQSVVRTGSGSAPPRASTRTPSGGSSPPSPVGEQLASTPKPRPPSGGLGSPSEKNQPTPPPNPMRDRGSGPECFPAGTLVMTPRGPVAIESLVTGDRVLAPAKELRTQASSAGGPPPAIEATRAHVIVRTTRLSNDHLRILTLTDASGIRNRVETTEGHRFWVEGKGWKRAMDLAAGDLLSRGDAGYATVESAVLEEHPEGVWVYNLEVEATRTYQVGMLGIVVHGLTDVTP